MTVAGARAGKTSTLLIPNLLLYQGSVLVLDPKGELASATAAHRASELGQDVYVLDPWNAARDCPAALKAQFNPLAELLETKPENLIDDAALMADALIQGQGENNAHWTSAARDFIRAAMLFMVMGPDRESANLTTLLANLVDSMGDEGNFLVEMSEFEPPEDGPKDKAENIMLKGRG